MHKYNSYLGALLSEDKIRQVYEIEQDSWAREKGLGEYINCNKCGVTSSKEAVYRDLHKDTRKLTVAKIENILGINRVDCPCCGSSDTKHIYGESHFEKMVHKFNLPEAFCTLIEDTAQKVRGFTFGYLGSLEYIYEKEFKIHFTEDVIGYLQKEYNLLENDTLLTVSSIGIDEENMVMSRIYGMMQKFLHSLPDYSEEYLGIIEAVRGSHMEWIYKEMGAESCQIESIHPEYINDKNYSSKTDILIQPKAVSHYKKMFPASFRDLVKSTKVVSSGL